MMIWCAYHCNQSGLFTAWDMLGSFPNPTSALRMRAWCTGGVRTGARNSFGDDQLRMRKRQYVGGVMQEAELGWLPHKQNISKRWYSVSGSNVA